MRVAGLDVAFTSDYMALVIVEKGSDKKIRLVHLATWKKMDWQAWKDDMRSKQSLFGISKIFVDQTNNQSVVMELKNLGINAQGVSFTNSSKRDMATNLTKLLLTRELVFPISEKIQSPWQHKLFEELFNELAEQEYAHDSANPSLSHPSGQHDDLLWALCLAVHGMQTEREFYGAILKRDL